MKGNGVGFFYPQSKGYFPFVDKEGNSMDAEAKADIYEKRNQQKKILSSDKYAKYIGQRAECPKESFASSSDNIFPSADISPAIWDLVR